MDDAFDAALAFVDEYDDAAFADDALHVLLPLHSHDSDDGSLLGELLSEDDSASAISVDAYGHAGSTGSFCLVSAPPRQHEGQHAVRTALTTTSEAASGNSCNGNDGSKSKKKKVAHKSNPNKARDERREEVIYLRKTVVELEARLRRLEQLQPRITANTTAATSAVQEQPSLWFEIRLDQRPTQRSDSHDGQILAATEHHHSNEPTATPSVWETVARRQRDHRVKAERENIRLKLVLENQLKIARSLEKILNRKASVREIEKAVGVHDEREYSSMPTAVAGGPTDAEVFEELVAGLDTAYAELDAVFDKNGLAHKESSFSDAVMRSGGSGYSIRLEISANEVVPFEMHATGKVTWHHLLHAKQRTPSRFYTYEFAKSAANEVADDTVLENFTLTLHAKNTSALLRVKQVLRRYVEEDRIVIVLRSVFYPMELGNEPLSGVIFRDTEYIVVKRPRTIAGDYSLLQTCYIYTPLMGNDHPKAGAITDFMLRATEANISASHDMIENVLLSQAAVNSASGGGLDMFGTSV
uniref:START domain-containing protein n=1 Tax=Globisporangium ultimum (strain ATCC 200006 / CBS 805.95 / DAOM BR144) TaxID=431595 RepID=K3WHC5_GLOUD